MKIAQIAPLYESVPPKYYGGTERVVSYLTEELIGQGHDVTLFASGDSVTKANLIAPCHRALRLDKLCVDHYAHHITMLEKVYQMASQFDIIHSHLDYLPFSEFRRIHTPHVTTLHGRLDLPDLQPLYDEFKDVPLVSISLSQRAPLPRVNWVGNIYHGLNSETYTFREKPGQYLAFLGRICPEKRVDIAIEIAKRIGMPLKIAAKVDNVDRDYFTSSIKPILDHPLIEYVGEIGDGEKDEFLGNAFALLFPIDWPEPFGMVMLESWACGTPVIARGMGSVPELVKPGVLGFVCNEVDEAVTALEKIPSLSRRLIRDHFEENFTVKRMAHDYLNVYNHLIGKTFHQGIVNA